MASTKRSCRFATPAGFRNRPLGRLRQRHCWIIVTHGNGHTRGYEIDRVEKRDGATSIPLTLPMVGRP